jgi:hypothetical protein
MDHLTQTLFQLFADGGAAPMPGIDDDWVDSA